MLSLLKARLGGLIDSLFIDLADLPTVISYPFKRVSSLFIPSSSDSSNLSVGILSFKLEI
jgi:hypothetical protein